MEVDLLTKAIQIATDAHKDQTDKSGKPYLGHVTRVMQAGQSIEEKIVGVLHDVVEDTDWTFEKLLEAGFPASIVDAIRCLTKKSEEEPYDLFIERVKTNPLAVAVKLNDLADNMNLTRLECLPNRDVARIRKYHKAYRELSMLGRSDFCEKVI